jgi:hypothetical protein
MVGGPEKYLQTAALMLVHLQQPIAVWKEGWILCYLNHHIF